MKRIFTLSAAAMMACCTFAQSEITTYSSCDTNVNGTVSIEDVTNTVNKVIGKVAAEQEVVTASDVNATLNAVSHKLDEILERLTFLEQAGAYEYPYVNGHQYVDLGLDSKTLWATCNVGASSAEEFGGYYAWGETTEQTDASKYSWYSYSLAGGNLDLLTKYCTNSDYGTVDDMTVLLASDDVATASWGEGWTMPTNEQMEELIDSNNTTSAWTTRNGVSGYLITSKKNSNSIFLPAAGYCSNGPVTAVSSCAYYWTSSLSAASYMADCLDIEAPSQSGQSGTIRVLGNHRYKGCSVRPVCKK